MAMVCIAQCRSTVRPRHPTNRLSLAVGEFERVLGLAYRSTSESRTGDNS